jgi:hypothetical protein
MTKKLTFVVAIVLCIAARGFAQDKAEKTEKKPAAAMSEMKREKAEANWPEGKLTIEYGSPGWKPEFAEQMKKVEGAWRLGNNMPTTCTITCGLMTEQGNLPPGTYTLALKPAGDSWGLLFYEAKTFFDPAFKTWWIKADAAVSESKMMADHLKIEANDKHGISVRFGTMVSNWTVKPIKCVKPYETDFLNGAVTAKFDVMALPLAGTTFKDTTIGVVTATQNDVTVRYHLHLTCEGEKCTLNFVNERAGGIAKEKAMLDDIVKRISGMIEKEPNPEMEARLTAIKGWGEQIDATAKRYDRLRTTATVEGTVAKREGAAATELGCTFDRPTGSVVLKLALANSDATFEVKPRENFAKPREKKAE